MSDFLLPMRRRVGGFVVAVISTVGATGCATHNTGENYRPFVDTKGVDFAKYEADLRDCQQYAAQVAGAADQAVAGAVAGAIFGALIAAAAGGGYSRNQHAAVGAVAGAAGGAASGERDQRSVINRRLSGRGYSVLQ